MALVDPELLAGWLGEVTIDRSVGNAPTFRIRWLDREPAVVTRGTVVSALEDESATLSIEGLGRLEITLDSRVGGLRESWTLLRVAVSSEVSAAAIELALDRLETLLRGHPVDWATVQKGPSAHLSSFRNIR
jgi:hypothetical protein